MADARFRALTLHPNNSAAIQISTVEMADARLRALTPISIYRLASSLAL